MKIYINYKFHLKISKLYIKTSKCNTSYIFNNNNNNN